MKKTFLDTKFGRKFYKHRAQEIKLEVREKAMERIDEYRALLMPKSTIIRSVLKSFPSIKIREVRAMLKKSFAYKHHG